MRPPLPVDWGKRMDADALREWRKLRRINQRDLGDILGVSFVTIARWETGERAMPPYLHLALESVERRLSFVSRAPGVPTRTPRLRGPKRRRGTTSIGME